MASKGLLLAIVCLLVGAVERHKALWDILNNEGCGGTSAGSLFCKYSIET